MKLTKTCLAMLLVLCLPLTALAHNKLQSTLPADQSVLQASPAAVELNFHDDTYLEQFELLGPDGKAVTLQIPKATDTARHFTIALPELGAGRYQVSWKVVGLDTHELKGEFSFTVAAGGAGD